MKTIKFDLDWDHVGYEKYEFLTVETQMASVRGKSGLPGVAGRLVKNDKEAKWLEAEKVTDVQVDIQTPIYTHYLFLYFVT